MKLNIQLLVFALFIQLSLAGVVMLIGGEDNGALPGYNSPLNYLDPEYSTGGFAGDGASGGGGGGGARADSECESGDWFCYVAAYTVMIIDGLISAVVVTLNLIAAVTSLIAFFLLAGITLTSVFTGVPWLALPLQAFFLIINLIVIIEIGLVIRSLLKQ